MAGQDIRQSTCDTTGMRRPFCQVDVFSTRPYFGNPVAVVLDAEGLTDDEMQTFARWTNLSETTFIMPASQDSADYKVRIFTPNSELPFAGHPTLGTCHAWLSANGGSAKDTIVQECAAGLVSIRRGSAGLAFAAPPLMREGPVDEEVIGAIADDLRIERGAIVDAGWADNGPGWIGVLLEDAAAVQALHPGPVGYAIGAVGPYPEGSPCAFEVRAFFSQDGRTIEDPVTGSLNASLAQWLLERGRVTGSYVASQGGALGREGRVHIVPDDDGTVWVGGATSTRIAGEVDL
jgi:PhzF family phenazine biosynthesis protein